MPGRVAVLLASYQGARFLPAQLTSLIEQTYPDWALFWRDDGSRDETPALLRAFQARPSHAIGESSSRLGAAGSFFHLLRAALADPAMAYFAFCDQDDVWNADKLERAVARLAAPPAARPALYCARAMLVDANLRPLGETPLFRRRPEFPAALAQNIAIGCTVLLNRAAAELVAVSHPPAETMHDWWSYLMVSAADGEVLADPALVLRYRQHTRNAIGAPLSPPGRAWAAFRRGPRAFMALFDAHLAALQADGALLPPPRRAEIAALSAALARGGRGRLALLFWPGLSRQTALETFLFRLCLWQLGGRT